MENLTTLSEIKRVLRMTNEIPDDELGSFISGASEEIYQEYGWPIASTQAIIDSDNDTYYIFPTLQQATPVFSVSRVLINGSLLSSGSYTTVTGSATVTLANGLASTYSNESIIMGYSPNIFNRLATFMTSLDVLQSTFLIAREGEEFPRTAYLTQKIAAIKTKLNAGVYNSSQFEGYSHYKGDYVYQDDIGGTI